MDGFKAVSYTHLDVYKRQDVYNTLVHNNVCFKLSYKLELREFVNG